MINERFRPYIPIDERDYYRYPWWTIDRFTKYPVFLCQQKSNGGPWALRAGIGTLQKNPRYHNRITDKQQIYHTHSMGYPNLAANESLRYAWENPSHVFYGINFPNRLVDEPNLRISERKNSRDLRYWTYLSQYIWIFRSRSASPTSYSNFSSLMQGKQ